ncbi:hypothetical protein Z043_116903 [Scleropages formosus]|uniref:DDB1- and CUL4-associated factor 13 n=1 Tax=Scleropages formosus TaxID=113540 RepID=A0A0P7UX93_SCLFO|nr:hypothetical protein Z043_116903 [Scleropages formosus]
MKVKVLCRNPDDYVRETTRDIQRVPRNYDPTLHPFEVPREYTRAMNATKLERVFAKPFVAALDGHRDAVNCMAKHPTSLSTLLSGSCDGEVKVWNLPTKKCVRTLQAHEGFVRGMCARFCGTSFFTVGDDKTIKQWKMEAPGYGEEEEPLNMILGRTELLASCASDRSIILYDMREATPLQKVIMNMRSNTLCWNPMEAYIFTCANEDYHLYTYDMRQLSMPIVMHSDHVSAVLDVDYSPTGKEFVSASFDKTIRIFPEKKSHSREVYHTKRMQHVICVKWSLDNKYIVTGSDEMNIRLWKANASEKLGLSAEVKALHQLEPKLTTREKQAQNYSQKLKQKFQHHPQIRRITRHRHLPREIYSQRKELHVMKEARRRKELNVRKHSKPGSIPYVSEKKKHVVAVVD